MSRTTINVPNSLELDTAPKFCVALQNCGVHNEYVLDFSRTRTVSPFGMLLVSTEIQRHASTYPEAKFSCTNFAHMTYAAHMGFFKAFGHDFGKHPGQAYGSKNYIPLTMFRTETLIRDAAMSGREVGDEIEAQSKRLAETLVGEDVGDAFETLSYSIRELIRNVVEHAQTDRLGICSQYWPSKGRAEVAIIDRGIGLRESLANNPHIDASTDKQAINFALMPAVSGKAFKGASRRTGRSPWANSGFGLYMTSRICRNGGNFFVATGDTGMLLTAGKGGKRYFNMSLQGTAVRMTVRTDQIAGLKDSLARFREEGFEIQKKYAEIVSIDPSSASLMLSEDFNLTSWDLLLRKIKSLP
jgi:hypothetical protein